MPPLFLALMRQKYLVALDSGPTCREVPVTVESFTTVEANSESVDSCTLYDVAPVEEFQPRFTVVGWPVAPLVGAASVGAAGTEGTVVKFRVLEYALVPPAFFAFTLQKYFVALDNGPTCRDVPVMVESLTTVVAKSESLDSCNLYDVAPVEAFQERLSVVA